MVFFGVEGSLHHMGKGTMANIMQNSGCLYGLAMLL